MEKIARQTKINFIYQDYLIENADVSCNLDNAQYEAAIKIILDGKNLTYKLFDNNSVVLYKKKILKVNEQKPIVVKERIPDTITNQVLIKPILITNIQPIYPPTAVWGNIEGNVTVNLLVDKKGDVDNVVIENSSDSEILDSAAMDYSKNLKFIPANSNGNSQSYWVKMTYRYFFNSDQVSNQ